MMKSQDLREEIERLEPWFHKIELGMGLSTKATSSSGEPADHPLGTWNIVQEFIPQDLSGCTVLDVGCNAGFYSIEAKRRGAKRVFAVDAVSHHIHQLHFVTKVLGLDIESSRLSLYELKMSELGQFDLTLALGLIYHCKHIMYGLEKLYEMTKDTLILESAILPSAEAPPISKIYQKDFGRSIFPIAYVQNGVYSNESANNWFLPSAQCLQAMLTDVGFDTVEIGSIFNEGKRAVFIGKKFTPFLPSTASQGLKANVQYKQGPTRAQKGESINYKVTIKNTGIAKWQPEGIDEKAIGAIFLGVRCLDSQNETVAGNDMRFPIPRVMLPGESAEMHIELSAPVAEGRYQIKFDLLSERVVWFEDIGSKPLSIGLTVN
jgi:tRNA (mo5U34)-methyltransferase